MPDAVLAGVRIAGLGVDTLTAIADEAALVAALTCTRPGADPPARAELEAVGRLR